MGYRRKPLEFVVKPLEFVAKPLEIVVKPLEFVVKPLDFVVTLINLVPWDRKTLVFIVGPRFFMGKLNDSSIIYLFKIINIAINLWNLLLPTNYLGRIHG